MRSLCRLLLKLLGWKLERELPQTQKYVLIGAPHTSNWDFVFGILALYAMDIPFRYLGKHTLFKGPFGWVFKLVGGIPVDRTRKSSLVTQLVTRFEQSESLVLVLAPEGTRSYRDFWKPGFYHIARSAKVPIALGYLDFARRQLGVGGWFVPTGVQEDDLETIRIFYTDKIGRRPELTSTIVFKADDSSRTSSNE